MFHKIMAQQSTESRSSLLFLARSNPKIIQQADRSMLEDVGFLTQMIRRNALVFCYLPEDVQSRLDVLDVLHQTCSDPRTFIPEKLLTKDLSCEKTREMLTKIKYKTVLVELRTVPFKEMSGSEWAETQREFEMLPFEAKAVLANESQAFLRKPGSEPFVPRIEKLLGAFSSAPSEDVVP